MDVRELNKDQMEQLKWNYFYQMEETSPDVLEGITSYQDIPDEVIFEHYNGISFVPDDFM